MVSVYTPELCERHPSAALSPPLEPLNTTPLTSSTTPAHLSPLSAAASRALHLARPASLPPQPRPPQNKIHSFTSLSPNHFPHLPKSITLLLVPPVESPFLSSSYPNSIPPYPSRKPFPYLAQPKPLPSPYPVRSQLYTATCPKSMIPPARSSRFPQNPFLTSRSLIPFLHLTSLKPSIHFPHPKSLPLTPSAQNPSVPLPA